MLRGAGGACHLGWARVCQGVSTCRKMDVASASGCVRTPSTAGVASEGAWLPPGVQCVPKGPRRGPLPTHSRPESPGSGASFRSQGLSSLQ